MLYDPSLHPPTAPAPPARYMRPCSRPEFNPVTLKFEAAADESAYLEWRRPALTRMARGVMIVGAVAALISAVIDWKELDLHAAEEMTAERFAVAFALILNAALLKTGWGQRRLIAMLTVGAAAVHLIWLMNVPHVEAHIAAYTGVLPIKIMLTMLLSGLMFRRAALVAAGAIGAYGAALMISHPDPLPTMIYLIIASLFAGFGGYAAERARRDAWAASILVEAEKTRSERLLLNVLPACIAERMKNGEEVIADRFDDAAVLFADLVGFTELSARVPPEALVRILDDVFRRFDRIAADLDLEKIKTIGDCYMLACGLPEQRRRDHARLADAALRMREEIKRVSLASGHRLELRIGMHAGPVVAGVIGEAKFVYDLWGDSVNVASRMESAAPLGAIQMTEEMRARLGDRFETRDRGEIDVKGKGRMRVWLLVGRRKA